MIMTVTLNPAIDKICTVNRLNLGQVNRMCSVKNIGGGKGINVAKILHSYGIPVTTLGFIGGSSGAFIEKSLAQRKIETAFTNINEETRVSTNIIADDGSITEILEPGPLVSLTEKENFLNEYQGHLGKSDFIILSGSAPRGIASNIYTELIGLAKKQNRKVLLDTSGDLLTNAVNATEAKPYMIKPNLIELEHLVKHSLKDIAETAEIIRSLTR
ncbi:MAG: hexose kinase, partial [Lachnospiraceae bacterium]|nr:hexose kinase [Lachnospiraceae bacterium]